MSKLYHSIVKYQVLYILNVGISKKNISYLVMNEESKRVLTLLDEIRHSQELVESRLNEANDSTIADLGNLKEITSKADRYVQVLRTLASDMIEVCERTEALRSRLASITHGIKK